MTTCNCSVDWWTRTFQILCVAGAVFVYWTIDSKIADVDGALKNAQAEREILTTETARGRNCAETARAKLRGVRNCAGSDPVKGFSKDLAWVTGIRGQLLTLGMPSA